MKYEWAYLRDVCRITAGFPFKRGDFGGEGKVIKTGDITSCGVKMESLSSVSVSAYDPVRVARFLAREGDCVLTMQGPREEIVKLAQVGDGEAYVNQGVTLLSPGPRVDRDYLFHALLLPDFKQYIKECLGDQKTPHVPKRALENYSLQLPPIAEQQKVAGVLRELDERCALNRKIVENLEKQAMHLYCAWFESFEPFDGQMPKSWGIAPLRRLTMLVDRGVVPEYVAASTCRVVNQKCVRGHSLDLSMTRTLCERDFGNKTLQYGDILINSTGVGTLGRTAQILFKPVNLTADRHVTILRPKKETLMFYLGLWAWVHEADFVSMQMGRTTQTELPRESLRAMELLVPDDTSLRRFNKLIEPLFAYRISALDEIQRLQAFGERFLYLCLRGEIEQACRVAGRGA